MLAILDQSLSPLFGSLDRSLPPIPDNLDQSRLRIPFALDRILRPVLDIRCQILPFE